MKEKIRRGIREIMIWINRIAAVSVAVCMVFICATSVIHLDTGKMEWTYVQTPVERERVRFEDSQIYKDVLQNQIIDITRMCVIRNQMETNGVYNGKKIIDNLQDAPQIKSVDGKEAAGENGVYKVTIDKKGNIKVLLGTKEIYPKNVVFGADQEDNNNENQEK